VTTTADTAPPPRPPESEPPAAEATTHDHGAFFWACLVVGWAVIVFGLHGILSNRDNPPALFRLLIGLNIVNDALVAPVLVVVAVAVRRVVPRWALVPVEVGLIATATLCLYAYPLVGGFGKSVRAGSSRLPWNYAHNLLVVLAAVWVVCALMALWSWRRTSSNPG
jgi:hypothetical protein